MTHSNEIGAPAPAGRPPAGRRNRFSRLAAVAAAVGMIAALSGCVIYPAWDGPHHHYYYWR